MGRNRQFCCAGYAGGTDIGTAHAALGRHHIGTHKLGRAFQCQPYRQLGIGRRVAMLIQHLMRTAAIS